MQLLPNHSDDQPNQIIPYLDNQLIVDRQVRNYSPAAEAEEPSPRINIGQLIRRHWLLVVLLLVLGAAGGFVSVILSTPRYRAHLLLEVQGNGTQYVKGGLEPAPEVNEVNVQTQVSILQSPTFLK